MLQGEMWGYWWVYKMYSWILYWLLSYLGNRCVQVPLHRHMGFTDPVCRAPPILHHPPCQQPSVITVHKTVKQAWTIGTWKQQETGVSQKPMSMRELWKGKESFEKMGRSVKFGTAVKKGVKALKRGWDMEWRRGPRGGEKGRFNYKRCVWKPRKLHIQTDRQIDRQIDRRTNGQMEK